MKLSLALLGNLLFASAVFAAPSGAERRARRALARGSKPFIAAPGSSEGTETNATHVDYSTNWSGVVLTTAPAGATFTAVSATFNVPTPTPSSSGSGTWSGSAWVGIDGYNTDNIWQSGFDFTVTRSSSGSLSYSYDAWYEWYPAYAEDFSGISFSAGDQVSVSIVTTSSSKGSVVLENLTTGTTVKKTVSSSSTLSGENAEWIVEAYESSGSQVKLAKFNPITFSSAVAKTSAGQSESMTGADTIDMETSSGTIITSVTIESGSEAVVKYV
ncbi:MAG: hypothetical protein M1818_007825 [Claussenomyces sp. TS43310]|nr:MAG: hypothetical protein M1818_007825 [Claussenomyces sp. TS43310]